MMSAIRNVSEIALRANWVFWNEENFMEAYDTPVPINDYYFNVFEKQLVYLSERRNVIYDNAEEMYSRMAVEEEMIWQLKLFLEGNSRSVDLIQLLVSLENCHSSLTQRAFNSTFDPLRYYEESYGENSNVEVLYDYESYFGSLLDMYEYFSANCANYFDSDTPRPVSGFINYHALFACQSYHTDCDVYVATKHLHANYILNHSRFADEVAETQQDVTQAYFSFINATFNGSYGSPLDVNPAHHVCVEHLASYGSDVMQLWAETGEPIVRVHLNLTCCEAFAFLCDFFYAILLGYILVRGIVIDCVLRRGCLALFCTFRYTGPAWRIRVDGFELCP